MKRLTIAALFWGLAIMAVPIAGQDTTPADTPRSSDFHIYFTEGDQVVKVAQRWTPDPTSAGSFYETFEWDPMATRVATAPGAKVPSPGCSASPAQLDANKTVANAFWRNGLTPPERIALVDPGYVQHNPFIRRFARTYGSTDFAALTFFATRAGTQRDQAPIRTANGETLTPRLVVRTIAACDVVMQIHRRYNEVPARSGTWVEQPAWDLFRVRDGKLVEHWDGSTL